MAEKIPAYGDQQVLIAKSRAVIHATNFDEPVTVIIPDSDGWNDFGRGYFAKLLLIGGEIEETEFRFRIMFEEYKRSETALKEFTAEYGEIFPIEKIEMPFVSLLPGEDKYGELIQALGFERGIAALRKLHDAVVLRLEGDNKPLVDLTFGEEFSVGILRADGAYSALRRGARHFTRDDPVSVDDSAQSFTFATKLRNSENEVEVDFDFGEKPVFRERISVLVGQNGVGKTQFLKSLIDGMITDANEEEAEHSPRFISPAKFHRTLVFSSVPTDPYPRQIGAWRGVDYDYFPLNTARHDGSESLLQALVALKFEDRGIQFEEDDEVRCLDLLSEVLGRLNMKQLCLPLRKRQEGDDLPNIIEIEGNSYLPIRRRFNEQNTLTAYQQIEWSRAPIVIADKGMLRDLSSGEIAMLRFSAQAIAAIETGSILLLDEPETHLHPKFVSDLIQILYSLLKATKSIAIIATHSAYVVREVSRENVKVMSVEDSVLSFDTPRMQTFGASIDTISQFAFGDTNERHHFQRVLVNWARSVEPDIGLEGIIHEFGEHLNSESLSLIARSLNQEEPDD